MTPVLPKKVNEENYGLLSSATKVKDYSSLQNLESDHEKQSQLSGLKHSEGVSYDPSVSETHGPVANVPIFSTSRPVCYSDNLDDITVNQTAGYNNAIEILNAKL